MEDISTGENIFISGNERSFLYWWCRYPSDTVKCKRGSGSYLRDWHRAGGGSEKEAD